MYQFIITHALSDKEIASIHNYFFNPYVRINHSNNTITAEIKRTSQLYLI